MRRLRHPLMRATNQTRVGGNEDQAPRGFRFKPGYPARASSRGPAGRTSSRAFSGPRPLLLTTNCAKSPKLWRCVDRIQPRANDTAVGFRRRDADGCDRDGRAPLSLEPVWKLRGALFSGKRPDGRRDEGGAARGQGRPGHSQNPSPQDAHGVFKQALRANDAAVGSRRRAMCLA